MIQISKKENCSGCFACVNKCPVHCISMKTDPEGFRYPEADASKCIDCGLCEKVCPVGLSADNKSKVPDSFAMKNRDAEERNNSSSGGVFALLAKEILRSGGIVYGAAFSDDFKSVYHTGIENTCDLRRLMGSKYLQSEIGSVLEDIKRQLESGRKVLFCGTPCQAEGLKAFLGTGYENLLTVDIICHGVPSPMVWRDYLSKLENEQRSAIRDVSFRHKSSGWKNYSILFEFENGHKIREPFRNNIYMKMFLRNLILRPSCYACSFKKLDRASDVTLADYWGIRNLHPDLDDDKGTSFVMVHSDKGREFIAKISEYAEVLPIELQPAVSANPAAVRAVSKHLNRDKFFKEYAGMPSVKKCEKYMQASTIRKFAQKIKRALRKLSNNTSKK